MALEIQTDVELAPLTTLGVGGPARYFVKAGDERTLVDALQYAKEHSLNVFVLGGGSNVLIADKGFDGLVIHIASKGISSEEADGRVVVTAQAGEDWDKFVAHCIERELAGVECLSGIPGTVGGTPVQNVGAYGQDVSESIVSVRCLDRRNGGFVILRNDECGFTYRKSIFNSTERDRYIVTSVTYALTPGAAPKIAYRDLIEHFAGREPSLSEAREAVLAIRRSKSMVIDPADPNSRSAGSFFKNPIVSRDVYEAVASRSASVPQFAAGPGTVKIPAAWLIENAGFEKGSALGNAGISSKHTLALINRGGATAADLLALKDAIQRAVAARFSIDLEPEPIMVGW
jgi:UDP-N-acetylmuramate dehydrogenase